MNPMGAYTLMPQPAEPPLIQVTGEGRLQVVPGTAVVFRDHIPPVQAADAFQQAAATVNRILQA